jgi:RNA-directed DNA polymerase
MSEIVKVLAFQTGLRETLVHRIMTSASVRYKTYHIPKRTGGFRQISQPAREVKALQRALIEILLSKLPVHPCATAYRSGASILENALPHAEAGPILKMDFVDFFPSIQKRDWVRYCAMTRCLEEDEDIALTSSLLFRREVGGMRLAIGAPSSPALSNILMYEFDNIISETIAKDHIAYTRYADDLTFSARRTGYLVDVKSTVRRIIHNLESPRLKIHDDKTTYVTKKFHRTVTGLTIANDHRITIGRENKRKIRAAVFKASKSELAEKQIQSLAGMLAYVKSVEPAFIEVLVKKYGPDLVKSIQRARRKATSNPRPPVKRPV